MKITSNMLWHNKDNPPFFKCQIKYKLIFMILGHDDNADPVN